MEQALGFVAQEESDLVNIETFLWPLAVTSCLVWKIKYWHPKFWYDCREYDHTIFYGHIPLGKCISLIVYVDDIVIIGDNHNGIGELKQHLFRHFQTKDLGVQILFWHGSSSM